jgi:hypothetical protein
MAELPIGELLDTRGMRLELNDGDLLVSAVIVAAVLPANSKTPIIALGMTEDMGAIEQVGLITAASHICAADWGGSVGREEEL